MPKVTEVILNGCFNILHRFKKLEQVRLWVISGYEEKEDADDELDGGTTKGQKAELYVQSDRRCETVGRGQDVFHMLGIYRWGKEIFVPESARLTKWLGGD